MTNLTLPDIEPGPWILSDSFPLTISTADGYFVIDGGMTPSMHKEAKAISKVPNMLDLLKIAVSLIPEKDRSSFRKEVAKIFDYISGVDQSEILKFAAKAIGCEISISDDEIAFIKKDGVCQRWNPFESEHDAFRLLVKLSLEIERETANGKTMLTVFGHGEKFSVEEGSMGGGIEELCLAITNVASMIGRNCKTER